VGTGTGTIARAIRPHVKHVVAVDPSSAMLAQGKWEDVSIIKWNISESFFADHIFHRVFARMVFHHIMDNLDAAILRCYDILKDGGRIIVAEGVPPEDDPEIVNWYTQMFKLKEDRRTFLPAQLVYFLQKNGFRDVKCVTHYMDNFSIRNWLENSGLDPTRQEAILELHRTAPAAVRNAYQLIERNGDVLIRTKNVVVVGER
jgi:ubiquinone/menaquinone biosynthesis C-methylase UbiE